MRGLPTGVMMYLGKEHPQLNLHLLQQLRLGAEVFLPLPWASVKCHAVTTGAVMCMAQGNGPVMIRALAGALPRPDVMNFRRCVTQVKVTAYNAAQPGYAGKIDTFCLSHAGPPADKAKHCYGMSSAEGVKMFCAPSHNSRDGATGASCSGWRAYIK